MPRLMPRRLLRREADKGKKNDKAHKRTISKVVTQARRETEREKDAQVSGDNEVKETMQIHKDQSQRGVYKSGKAPKPSKRR